MLDADYDNGKLAEDYEAVADCAYLIPRKESDITVIKSKIADSLIDLPGLYRENGNLNKLNSFDKSTRIALELILERGVEGAKTELIRQLSAVHSYSLDKFGESVFPL